MLLLDIITQNTLIPQASNQTQVKARTEQWVEHVKRLSDSEIRNSLTAFGNHHDGKRLLQALFGNSPYLSQTLLSELHFFHTICNRGFEDTYDQLLQNLNAIVLAEKDEKEIMQVLRISRRRAALLIALADLTGSWNLEQVTESLSTFADTCIILAVNFLLTDGVKRDEIKLKNPDNPINSSGLLIIAMGKLGSFELNYSSDIDFIVFYDDTIIDYTGRTTASHFFVRLTQNIINLLSTRTKDGYVFRTDLRLRPDPGSTPIAISLNAAETYYENLGQNWERAAMIKARVIIGDQETSERFNHFRTPYVWRRSLDFYSIQDIHSIKRQIDSREGKLPDNLFNYNVKLGHGGIREIEFFVQTQQLIWGGRHQDLRTSKTCKALVALTKTLGIDKTAAEEMKTAYEFYRTVEHRLQMINDQQTHSLPDTPEKMLELAIFLGFKDSTELHEHLMHHIKTVKKHYQQLFESSPSLASDQPHAEGSLVFTGSDSDPETLKTLELMGFKQSEMISETIRGWHHGRYRSTRTKRARELLTELMPILLNELAETLNPDNAFIKFDEFIKGLPAGIQIFSLLHANPPLLSLIADIMGGYPFISETLSHNPKLLDYVLAPEFYRTLPNKEELEVSLTAELAKSKGEIQDILDTTRNWVHDRQFRIGIQVIRHTITPDIAVRSLSDIADIVILTLFKYVKEAFEKQYGTIKGAEFAIVALGKLGSQTLMYGSDLDLIFIYDVPDKAETYENDHPLSPNQYFARLSRRFISACTALTHAGKLYEIDLRLRPSGNAGPVAISCEAFDKYYGTSAWAWEYMALTRARITVASKKFSQKLNDTINNKLQHQWDQKALTQGILDMHRRVKSEHATSNLFDVKYADGGLLDLEYIVQFLILKHASKYPSILHASTEQALSNLYDNQLISDKAHSTLLNANNFYLTLQFILRLIGNEAPIEKEMTNSMKKTLAEHLEVKDFKILKKILVNTQKKVQKLFYSIIK